MVAVWTTHWGILIVKVLFIKKRKQKDKTKNFLIYIKQIIQMNKIVNVLEINSILNLTNE